ncbi:MAG: MalY/PatB family protein [Holophaga sp.]|jgi:cystathionine beta-lyase
MPFNFDEVIDRSGTNSVKWSGAGLYLKEAERAAAPLPMWVADMDFRSPEPVLEALREAVDYGIFGYPAGATRGYVRAVLDWQGRRFGWEPAPEWLVQVPGVITGLKTLVQVFSSPGDSVLVQPPVYIHFHADPVLIGRQVAWAPLALRDGRYAFDPETFAAAIRPDTKLFILSNPHNPTGNVWSEDELRAMGEICFRHGILVVSDEIHQDFVLNPARRHIPFASLGPAFAANSFICTSASKTFNLAGLQCANLFVPDPRRREEVRRQIDRNFYSKMNLLGMVATEAAYTHGEPWLAALLDYLGNNQRHFASALNARTGKVRVHAMDSLFLAWIDCRELGLEAEALSHFMLTRARVWFDQGQKFGPEGHGFLRANLGCPRRTVDEALERLGAVL